MEDVLRCRAVCKSWHSGTSTNAFILDHHHRQPSLPIIQNIEGICRVAGPPGDQKIWPVIRYSVTKPVVIHRACDGLLILGQQSDFYICNPTTRKCASLPHPPRRPGVNAVTVVAFYRHHASREYGVLWVSYSEPVRIGVPVQLPEYFVLTVGSNQPRCIKWPTVSQLTHHVTRSSCCPPVHHRGSLHWAIGLNLTVFDSIAETFRQMSRPIELGAMVSLLDMGGSLALWHTTCDCLSFDIWVLQDYDAETWRFQYRINLLAMEASPPLNLGVKYGPSMAVINEHELLIAQRPDRLFRCDTDGLFLGNVESEEHGNHLILTRHRLQESMISLPIFEAQEEDDVNKEPPFLIVL
ncbi:hypothetical protein ZWY2020_041475 [Hordeum vulgare]|nr:hypothetical protein ZWY2020_041475 [Hordeum vulgare]